MRTGTVLIAIALVGFAASPAEAANSVVVESKTVCSSSGYAELGIFLSNSERLAEIVLPIELRTVGFGDAFLADSILVETHARAATGLDLITLRFYGTPDSTFSCSGPVSLSYTVPSPSDFISPDGLLWAALSTSLFGFEAGSDGSPGLGVPSILLRFGINGLTGVVEVDTCCIAPANHLSYVGIANPPIFVSFEKGTLSVMDNPCECHADPVCDSVSDVLDVIAAVEEAFKNAIPAVDSLCAHKGRVDINCDCLVDVLDVVGFVNRVFRGDTSLTCSPCDFPCSQ